MKISFNVPNDIGEKIKKESDIDHLALKAFELVYFFLEKSGKTLDQITPELLELGESLKKGSIVAPKKNRSVSALLAEIKTNGGIKKETAEEIRKSGREFREDFQLEHDKL
jgi:hypothetical protein